MLKIDLKQVSVGGDPYENFQSGIKDPATKRHYVKYLDTFLGMIPPSLYKEMELECPDKSSASMAKCFADLCAKDSAVGTNIISEYIKHHKRRAESGEISPNTLPNYIKPIKVLLDTNDIVLHWKRLYHLYPRERNSEDRAYAREEIQKMMDLAHDLTDQVILTMFSSAGFRLESWDYFTWQDVILFTDDDGKFKGGALLVYRGDPESYWTFITPEACYYLSLYREKWKKDTLAYPRPNQPLLKIADRLGIQRLLQKGVRKRVAKLAEEAGLRPPLPKGKKRHAVKLDHGFRKYFNTMLRRAKVNYLDKEDMMGHKVGLEKNYERYVEEDFERFPEYQKAIPFLTISDTERLKLEVETTRKSARENKKLQSENNAMMMQEIKELRALTEKLEDAGILDMIKNTSTCARCKMAYVGEQCPKCAHV